MSKSFKKLSPIAMRKAMQTIENICMIGNGDEKNHILNDIYRIAHSHAGHCDNHHDSLEEYRDEIIKECESALFAAVELREFLDADKQNEKEWIDSVLKQL